MEKEEDRFALEHLDQVDLIGPDGQKIRFDKYVAEQDAKPPQRRFGIDRSRRGKEDA